jgi:mannuronan 5-epimerase
MLRIETTYSIPIVFSLLFSLFCVLSLLEANVYSVKPKSISCISYDAAEMVITVKCQTASLRDIDNHLNNPGILCMENADGVWLLNASIVVDKGATLYVNSSDLSWFKLLTRQGNGGEGKRGADTNIIEVHGSLKIDSVKVTSWNLSSNDYGRNPGTRDLSEN